MARCLRLPQCAGFTPDYDFSFVPCVFACRKITLNQIQWTIFDAEGDDFDMQVKAFIQVIQGEVNQQPLPEDSITDNSALMKKRGGRLNTKLRQQSTLQDLGVEQIDTFWDRNFKSDDEVPWYKFQKCFLEDYEAKLSSKTIKLGGGLVKG